MHSCSGMGEPDFANMIRNGSFGDRADGWLWTANSAVATFAASPSRSVGTGCLSVMPPAASTKQIIYRPRGLSVLPLGNRTVLDAVAYVKSDDETPTTRISLAFYSDTDGFDDAFLSSVESAEINPDSAVWTIIESRDVAVPLGAQSVKFQITIVGASGASAILFDDLYMGAPGGDDPPYPVVSTPLPLNRILDGTFESGMRGWEANASGEVFELDASAPIVGTQSLKVTTEGNVADEGAWYHNAGRILVVAGESLRLTMQAKGSGTVYPFITFHDGFSIVNGDPVVLSASPVTITLDATVPANKDTATVGLITKTDPQAITYWIDEVSLANP